MAKALAAGQGVGPTDIGLDSHIPTEPTPVVAGIS